METYKSDQDEKSLQRMFLKLRRL